MRIFLVALALCLSSGSITAQQADFAPQPGKASIVVFRATREPLLSAHNVDYPIAFDEQWISNLPKGEYFVFPAWPGRHRIALALRMQHSPSYAWERGGCERQELLVGAHGHRACRFRGK